MIEYGPIARIILRYVIGALIGAAQADMLAADPDIVTAFAIVIGAVVELIYALAKRKGWAT